MNAKNIFVLLLILTLFSCNTVNNEPLSKKTKFTLTINNCKNLNNFNNLFDDMQLTNFKPDELSVYSLSLGKNTITKMEFVPTKRRGYSDRFAIIATAGDKIFSVTNENPVIDFGGTNVDKIDLIFVNYQKSARKEFYRDSVPFVIETENDVNILGFNSLLLYDGNKIMNDTTIVRIGSEKPQSKLNNHIFNIFKNKLDGELVGKKVCYKTSETKTSGKIFEDGTISLLVDNKKFIHGLIKENSDGKFYIEIDKNIGFKIPENQSADMYINNKILEVPSLDLKLTFEASDMDFLNLKTFSDLFFFDIRYATDNNFTKIKLYDEPICYLRYAVARDLMEAARTFISMGYKIKMFDGYRPYRFQGIMWNVCPNPNFLTNPLKGSNHNRGVAVDLTICTPDGKNLDMGTDFDHEGFAAYTTNMDLPEQVLKNRLILSDNLNRFGFSKIRTEWWHFSDRNYISASSICDFIPKEYIEF